VYTQPPSGDRAAVQTRSASVGSRRYALFATPGCLAFAADKFIFNLRGVAEATPCAPDAPSR
jgi:hypothetical protein